MEKLAFDRDKIFKFAKRKVGTLVFDGIEVECSTTNKVLFALERYAKGDDMSKHIYDEFEYENSNLRKQVKTTGKWMPRDINLSNVLIKYLGFENIKYVSKEAEQLIKLMTLSQMILYIAFLAVDVCNWLLGRNILIIFIISIAVMASYLFFSYWIDQIGRRLIHFL